MCVVSGLLVAAELLSSVKRTITRTLFILASLHIHTSTYVQILVRTTSWCHDLYFRNYIEN